MRIGISLGGAMASADIGEQLAYVQEAEKLGVHSVWTVEGWGYDAVTPLAFSQAKPAALNLVRVLCRSVRVPPPTSL